MELQRPVLLTEDGKLSLDKLHLNFVETFVQLSTRVTEEQSNQ